MIENIEKNIEEKITEDFAKLSKMAKTDLGDFWDILDSIESNSKGHATVFPYGDNTPKPYGWHR